VKEYPVIIVGAGIGGLTVAAYLSKRGIPALVLEQGNIPGGRCSTRFIKKDNYEIGALYIGGGVYENLKTEFGIALKTMPVRCYIRIDDGSVSFPISWKTLLELNSCGTSWVNLLRFVARSRILADALTFEKYDSVGDVLDVLTDDKVIRGFFNAVFGVSGVSPYMLPSRYLYTRSELAKYKTDSPAYLTGGNGEIAVLLYNFSKKKCDYHFNESVNRILVEDGRVVGVRTTERDYKGNIIVSNAGIRTTVLSLTKKNNWNQEFYNEIASQKETLKVVNIFIRFSCSFRFPEKYMVYFLSENIDDNFSKLEAGFFPDNPMFTLHIPSNNEPDISEGYSGTLQFYCPRGKISNVGLRKHVNYIMTEGLEKLFRGLSAEVTRYIVYDPDRYEKEFGFAPCVFGIAPDFSSRRFPIETEIENLYCVGDSVAPDGPCVPQAMESGLICARAIFSKLT